VLNYIERKCSDQQYEELRRDSDVTVRINGIHVATKTYIESVLSIL